MFVHKVNPYLSCPLIPSLSAVGHLTEHHQSPCSSTDGWKDQTSADTQQLVSARILKLSPYKNGLDVAEVTHQ